MHPSPLIGLQVVSGQSQIWNCTLRYCSVFERLFSPTACGSHCITTLGSALTGDRYFHKSVIQLDGPIFFFHFHKSYIAQKHDEEPFVITGCTLSSIVNDRQAEFFEGWSFSQEVQVHPSYS